MYNISFPNLNLYFNINPVAFSFGKIKIYWYGILIAFSIILGLVLAKRKDGKYEIKFKDIEDFIFWALPISIIFARLYYVVFSWEMYKDDLISIFKIWNGGLAIYGGIIGAILTAIIYCKIKKIKLMNMLDYLVPYLALGQAIGRWGNFFNREAYGSVTNSFLRMEILKETGEYISVHPTFLYESIGLVLIFLILVSTKRKFSGQIIAMYFFMYGIIRTGIEWLRSDSLMLGNIKVSMLLSILLVICSIFYLIINIQKNKVRRQ